MNEFVLHILSITALTWITYAYIVWKGGFVIDDIEGIAQYDGKLPKGADYGDYMKWLRYKVADKIPRHHHCFSVILKNACCVMLYFFLNKIIGAHLAWLACMLFVVSPTGVQVVAWVSGIGYLIGLFMALVALQVQSLSIPEVWGLSMPLYALFTILAIIGNFTMLSTFLITLLLKEYPYVLVGGIISLAMGVQIVRQTIAERTGVFMEQNMGHSTMFKWRKIIVAVKTLLYYTCLALFPARLGLYHKWGFHYETSLEKENNRFWIGVLLLIGFGFLFHYGNPVVRFGIIWYFSFIFIFLNWITIHQFVSERYVYIASIGLWIILANYLAPYPLVYSFILGLYLMRTWQHLPTFQNEITFYQSNIWNFPKSEVALSNLGAVYMKCGLGGSAVDMWNIATRLNPQYDVPFYNLYSVFRAQRQWGMARGYIIKAIESPLSHFKVRWQKELEGFDKEATFFTNFMTLRAQRKFQEARALLVATLADQTTNPIYVELVQENTFKDVLQKELKVVEQEVSQCVKKDMNSSGTIAGAVSSNSLPQSSSS